MTYRNSIKCRLEKLAEFLLSRYLLVFEASLFYKGMKSEIIITSWYFLCMLSMAFKYSSSEHLSTSKMANQWGNFAIPTFGWCVLIYAETRKLSYIEWKLFQSWLKALISCVTLYSCPWSEKCNQFSLMSMNWGRRWGCQHILRSYRRLYHLCNHKWNNLVSSASMLLMLF